MPVCVSYNTLMLGGSSPFASGHSRSRWNLVRAPAGQGEGARGLLPGGVLATDCLLPRSSESLSSASCRHHTRS